MRTIKFRGKRPDNGAWETGGIVPVNVGLEAVAKERWFISCKHIGGMSGDFEHGVLLSEVDPATVGQFVGVYNGQDLYEGDILRVDSGYNIWFTVVQFDQERLAYHRLQDYGIGKVIGNIHDNPELLK